MKLLIVKLGAMGDVLRTTPLLTVYKRKFPGCHITWVVEDACKGVLQNNLLIDELLIYSDETLQKIKNESYDLAFNLDKEPEALNSIEAANAQTKLGFGWNEDKSDLKAINEASNYAVQLGIDDELKFRQNKKTYQMISYEQLELPYTKDDYVFSVSDEDMEYALNHLNKIGLSSEKNPIIGLNTGSGPRFAGKRMSEGNLKDLTVLINEAYGSRAVLLGGPEEHERNERLAREVAAFAVDAGTHHTIGQFAAIVSQLDLVVTGDTIAMHIAIAMKVPCLVYFGSTCEAEIELYGRGKKILTTVDCAPCYKSKCPTDEECMQEMTPQKVFQEIQSLIAQGNPV